MIAADRILIRKAECAAIIDLLRQEGRTDSARLVETRLGALSDALAEARAAESGTAEPTQAATPHAKLKIVRAQWSGGSPHTPAPVPAPEQPDPQPAQEDTRDAAAAEAETGLADAEADDEATTTATPSRFHLDRLTPEREAALRRYWHRRDISWSALLEKVNAASPGPGYSKDTVLMARAKKLGLGPRHPKPERPEPPPAPARPAVQLMPPTAPRAEPPAPPAPAMPADERQQKARALMRDGYDDQVIARRQGLAPDQVALLRRLAEQQARQMLLAGAMSTEEIAAATHLPAGTIRKLRQEAATA